MGQALVIGPENSSPAIWGRLIEANRGELSPEFARELLRIDFPPEDHRRVGILGAKARDGTLTDAERAELDDYIRVEAELAVVQSRARLALKRADP